MKKKEKPVRMKKLTVRLPEDEWEEWKNAADALKISLSEYIRRNVRFGRVEVIVKNELELPGIRKLMEGYGKIGSNINQIAHYLNAGFPWSQDMLAFLKKQLTDLRIVHNELLKAVRKFNGDIKTYSKQKRAL